MKRLITTIALLASVTCFGATWKYQPLINGWNVLVSSNATVKFGDTNVLFTYNNGGVWYSLTNNTINGNTNFLGATAFTDVSLSPDANGGVNSNMALSIAFGNTNMIPMVGTNTLGQYIVTNNWPPTVLAADGTLAPAWNPYSLSATTNYYPQIPPGVITNTITVTLAREVDGVNPGNGPGDTLTWGIVLNTNLNAPQIQTTNIPSSFITGARKIRLVSIQVTAGAASVVSTNNGTLINQIGLSSWVP